MNIRLATPAHLSDLLQQLKDAPYVALDTEFHPERRYLPQLYLVQLLPVGGHAWIVDPLDSDVLPGIAEVLQSRPWLVHSGFHDIRLLRQAIGGVPKEIYDTQVAAALVDVVYPASYSSLTEKYLGQSLEKTETLSDWSRRPLTREQLSYAANDVIFLPPLWEALLAAADGLQRRQAVFDACDDTALRTLSAPSHWRDLPGSIGLTPRQAAILEQVFEWRETVAVQLDQPTKALLPDPVLLEIAKRQPSDISQLQGDRRLPKNLARRWGEELIQRVHTALHAPEADLPRTFTRNSGELRQLAWLELFAEVQGARHQYSGKFVLPRRILENQLLYPETRAVPSEGGLSPWRATLVQPGLLSAFSGEYSLSLDPSDVRCLSQE